MDIKDNKKWENIGLSNDFLFGKVMSNPRLCKKLLELMKAENCRSGADIIKE